jgi:hypothetical protein
MTLNDTIRTGEPGWTILMECDAGSRSSSSRRLARQRYRSYTNFRCRQGGM